MGLSRMHFSGLSLSMHLSGLSLSSLSEGLALLLLHPQHGRPLRSIGIFFFFPVAHQAPLSMGFPRQEYWRGLPSPSPIRVYLICVWTCAYICISSVQLLSRVRLFETPWTAARQASLSITNSRSSPKLMLVTPSKHLILCRPLLLPPSIFPSIRVFSNDSVLCIRWPNYWSS